jgi:hypothetical protein
VPVKVGKGVSVRRDDKAAVSMVMMKSLPVSPSSLSSAVMRSASCRSSSAMAIFPFIGWPAAIVAPRAKESPAG